MTDGYKIKRVLIWQNNVEKQIYPKPITETYSLSITGDTSGSFPQKFTSIYKEGYRPSKVVINAKDTYLGGTYSGGFLAITITSGNIEGTSYLCTSDAGIWQPNNLPGILKRLSGVLTKYREFTNSSWFNLYGSNNVEFTIGEDSGKAVVNGNELTWTCTSDEKSFIGTLFDSSSLCFALGSIRENIEGTCTVTYKPI